MNTPPGYLPTDNFIDNVGDIFCSGPLIPEEMRLKTKYSDGRSDTARRKDHPPHEPTGVTDVLTFYPTLDEFRDFNGYIKKIEASGAHLKSGICKVVPPEEWHPRPIMKNDYSNIDDFEIDHPVKEKIEGRSGVFVKTNTVYRRKLKVSDFRKLANSAIYRNPKPNLKDPNEIESQYFNNILNGQPIYGADTEGSIYEQCVDEFNMNKLGTILDETKEGIKINGVNTVYLYFGMYKTTFPWHAEDMDLYSINYLHHGAPKYWFAISPECADRFERLMSQQFTECSNSCKAFLRHKTCIVAPAILRNNNIPYGTMIQRPNEFIITFPKGYHMGFNLGYNIAESTNFASDRWIDYGKNTVLCKCQKDSVEIDMRPFMRKYRPEEFESWRAYWYDPTPYMAKIPKSKRSGKRKLTKTGNDESSDIQLQLPMKKSEQLSSKRATDFSSDSDASASPIPEICNGGVIPTGARNLVGSRRGPFVRKNSVDRRLKFKWKQLQEEWNEKTGCLLSDGAPNLYAEKVFNQREALHWPHCAVCSAFQPQHMRPAVDCVPQRSERLLNEFCFAKSDRGVYPTSFTHQRSVDPLLTCANCDVTVHPFCYGEEGRTQSEDENAVWRCLRCRAKEDAIIRSASCSLCILRGGALIPYSMGNDRGFAHVICAIFNRRTWFTNQGPAPSLACHRRPPAKHGNWEMKELNNLPSEYINEFGEAFERAKFECTVCHTLSEGLINCSLCFDNSKYADGTLAHATCARQYGYLLELRNFPRITAMICDKHVDSHLLNDGEETLREAMIKNGTHVVVNDGGSDEAGVVQRIELKRFAVVDFLDGTVSRDIRCDDIVKCECTRDCGGSDHLYGSRVIIKWEDDATYEGFFRGRVTSKEYTVMFKDGSIKQVPISNLFLKDERGL